ncbi:MAG: alcohol dehydrogenase catalytic domain-containing protein, partial [Myxococcota bacterium]
MTGAGAPSQVLELGERAAPEPLAGELGVAVRAAAVGLPDVFLCRGSYEFKPPRPFTPGQEVAGIVSDARHAPGFEPGQRVMGVTTFYRGNGGFAEHATLVADTVWPIPEAMSDVEAAGFPIPFRTAWLGLVTRGGLAPGETVLVHGASGGAGYAAVQLGKALGAVATTPTTVRFRATSSAVGAFAQAPLAKPMASNRQQVHRQSRERGR